ncbi:hypothetical protein GCM10009347_19970 [Shewanella algicola]|uniref:TapY2 family type IVa secretion system protein n=1 Tax=Shewanella algicola TaxID=640633 RepID=A0A9X2CAU3_9GAMM|nr:TapY2 family type IVa secretion system protein [Shewanella algicola]MCL1105669.1 TapY2 family type IVa secretion system protein [Shewanella algicola]GGP53044.1 hypothetical protein GCM10009347_19970 [Shewanella algicola]
MNIITPITALLALLLSMNAIAEESTSGKTTYVTYKCHIETPNGPNIAVFSWDPKLLIEKQGALLAEYVPTVTNERLIVKRIVECLTEDKVFKDALVRELDDARTY